MRVQGGERQEDRALPGLVLANQARDWCQLEGLAVIHGSEIGDLYVLQPHVIPRCCVQWSGPNIA